MIQFLLNQTFTEIAGQRADLTVLEYLRNHKNLSGTKEGCASGDCGACTVVLASLVDDTLEYSAINSCITFIGALHGKQLITVEHLQHGDKLHPVQQAMVDCHGSQCGFCTPGFVMSMFALAKSDIKKDRHSIDEFLSGNLCRCTGYRPIVDAAMSACSSTNDDQFSSSEADTVRQLKSILSANPTDGSAKLTAPTTVAQLSDILADAPDTRLCAGSTDLALEVTQQLRDIDRMVYVGRVVEMLDVSEEDASFRIGAAVTYSRCYPLLRTHYPEFADMLLRLGSRQIRNQGTLGGNIGNASPIGDTPPVLIALRASVSLQSRAGIREIPVEDYFHDYKKTDLQPGEFIRDIVLPKPLPGYVLKVYKVSKRLDDDISAVLMAVWINVTDDGRVDDVVIACGGMAAIPKRATACESALLGKLLDQSTINAARQAIAGDFNPIDDVRASADYRTRVVQNLLERLYIELTQAATLTQVSHYG